MKSFLDSIPGARVCTIYSRPDYDGFGFSMRANDKGPHQISSVEANSPAMDSGLRGDDLILKVNDLNVVGERYSKTVALIKNESEKGRLKLEVIDPYQCPPNLKDTLLAPQSGYSTISGTKEKSSTLGKKSDSTQNLRLIAAEAREVEDKSRAVSVDTATRQRPLSMSDAQGTIKSANSFGSGLTGTSERINNKIYIFL